VSKTPDENEADMEAGMTTAERRRRRRRGGGLRVPSDNVPRRNSSPAVVPLPDDPSLAIAYSGSAEDSLSGDSAARTLVADPIAPDAVTTLIDPPAEPIEEISFESKTREMSAVDLEALGLADGERPDKADGKPAAAPEMALHPSTVIVDEELVSAPPSARLDGGRAAGSSAAAPMAPPSVTTNPGVPPPPATSSASLPVHSVLAAEASASASLSARTPLVPAVSMAVDAPRIPPGSAPEEMAAPPLPPMVKGRAPTLALSDDDLEELLDENRRQHLAEEPSEVGDSGEFEVEMEVDAAAAVPVPMTAQSAWSSRVSTLERPAEASGSLPVTDRSERGEPRQATPDRPDHAERSDKPERSLTPLGVPIVAPAVGPAVGAPASTTATTLPPLAPPATASSPGDLIARAKTTSVPPPMPSASSVAAAAPPAVSARPSPPPAPPPVAVKPPPAPPAPPKRPSDKRPTPPASAPQEQDRKSRSKAWFADVFDEDYLRTLPFLTPQATQAEAELVAASLGTSPGAKLLDVGCGYGRHAMELAARGYHVVGLDLSTPLLVRGGEEAHRRGLTINFIRGDMRELDFDGQFDGAYCLFSTFGYFDDETNKKTAGNIARALRPGGRCVFEILNRDYIIADLPTRVWWEGDGCVVLEEVDFNYFSSRICVNRSVVFDDGRQLEQEISIRAYSLHEVGKLMLAAGFRVLEVSGSYQTRGRFFGNQSRHIIVVAERAP
jgi:SAM-dependent methyltransferase